MRPVLVLLLSFLCLVMVFSKTYKHDVDVLLRVRSYLAARSDDFVVLSVMMVGVLLNLERVPPLGICSSDTLLQI